MVKFVSATDVAIAVAVKRGTLEMKEYPSRFGGTVVAICDDVGLIEVADDFAAADKRVNSVKARAA